MKKENVQYYDVFNKLTSEQKVQVGKYLNQSSNDKTIGRLQDAIELADYEHKTNTLESVLSIKNKGHIRQ